MFKITFVEYEGLLCPLALCAVCDQPITSGRRGLVTWDRERYAAADVTALHKGACDLAHSAAHGQGPWRDLDDFLSQLALNTKDTKIVDGSESR